MNCLANSVTRIVGHKPDFCETQEAAGGGEIMNASDIQKELRETLLEFVKRASDKNATAAEVEALPAVAQVLKEMVT